MAGRHRKKRQPVGERLLISAASLCFAAAGIVAVVHYQAEDAVLSTAQLALPAVAVAPAVTFTPVPLTPTPAPAVKVVAKPKKAISTKRLFGGVQPHVQAVGAFLKDKFDLETVDGNTPRPKNPSSDHMKGLALDLHVPDKSTGNELSDCVLDHKDQWHVKYVIWQKPEHYDHVHISFIADAIMPTDLDC